MVAVGGEETCVWQRVEVVVRTLTLETLRGRVWTRCGQQLSICGSLRPHPQHAPRTRPADMPPRTRGA